LTILIRTTRIFSFLASPNKAIIIGHVEVLRLLIGAGADLDLKDKVADGGITALIEASKFNRIETVRELIRAGANINSHDIGGETALYIASRDGHVEIVSELLAAGALVNAKFSGGWTALHNAARGGHNGVVYELLRFGADPKIKNNDSETAADIGRNDEVKTTISKAEAIRGKKLAEDEAKVLDYTSLSLFTSVWNGINWS
jgi:ankyrin repeat protein